MIFCLEGIDFVSPCCFCKWKGNKVMIQITNMMKKSFYSFLLLGLTPSEEDNTYYLSDLFRERDTKSSLTICRVFKITKSWGVKFNTTTYNAGPTLARVNNKLLNMKKNCEFLLKRAFEMVVVTGSSKMLTSEVCTAAHLRPVRAKRFRA